MMKDMLLSAPPGEMDESMREIIRRWYDKNPTSLQILEALDDGVRSASCSGFVITVLEGFLERTLKDEGRTLDEVVAQAAWRKKSDPPDPRS